jgi:hypothetical protein
MRIASTFSVIWTLEMLGVADFWHLRNTGILGRSSLDAHKKQRSDILPSSGTVLEVEAKGVQSVGLEGDKDGADRATPTGKEKEKSFSFKVRAVALSSYYMSAHLI